MAVGLQNAKSYPREFYLYENSNNDGVAKVVYERFVFQEFCREQKWTNPRVVGLEKELQSDFCSCRLLEF